MNKTLRNFILTAKACAVLYFASVYGITQYYNTVQKDTRKKVESSLEKAVSSDEFKRFKEEYRTQLAKTQEQEHKTYRFLNLLDSLLYLFE